MNKQTTPSHSTTERKTSYKYFSIERDHSTTIVHVTFPVCASAVSLRRSSTEVGRDPRPSFLPASHWPLLSGWLPSCGGTTFTDPGRGGRFLFCCHLGRGMARGSVCTSTAVGLRCAIYRSWHLSARGFAKWLSIFPGRCIIRHWHTVLNWVDRPGAGLLFRGLLFPPLFSCHLGNRNNQSEMFITWLTTLGNNNNKLLLSLWLFVGSLQSWQQEKCLSIRSAKTIVHPATLRQKLLINLVSHLVTVYWSLTNLLSHLVTVYWSLTNLLSHLFTVYWSLTNLLSHLVTVYWSLTNLLSHLVTVYWSLTNFLSHLVTVYWSLTNFLSHLVTVYWSLTNLLSHLVRVYWSLTNFLSHLVTVYWSLTNFLSHLVTVYWSLTNFLSHLVTVYWSLTNFLSHLVTVYWSLTNLLSHLVTVYWSLTNLQSHLVTVYWSLTNLLSHLVTVYWSLTNFTVSPSHSTLIPDQLPISPCHSILIPDQLPISPCHSILIPDQLTISASHSILIPDQLTISPSQSILIPDQPVSALALQRWASNTRQMTTWLLEYHVLSPWHD